MKKDWDPDSQTITFTTNSKAGSGDKLYVDFYDTTGGAGFVTIRFNTEIEYYIGSCRSYTSFPNPAAIPAETKKTWTITYNHAVKRVVFHCNGVQVADVVLSSACSNSGWTKYWEPKPTQMKLSSSDGASDTYCFSSNPGKYNGVIDSGE